MIDLTEVKAKKLYLRGKGVWTAPIGRHTVYELPKKGNTKIPEHVKAFRLSPITGEYSTQYIDIDYGCSWLITSAEGGVCGVYSRPYDYEPRLNCKDYPILTHQELFDCVLEFVARNPESIVNVPNGLIQNQEDAKLFMSRFKEVAKEKMATLTNQSDKEYWVKKVAEYKALMEKNLKKILKVNQKVEQVTNSTI